MDIELHFTTGELADLFFNLNYVGTHALTEDEIAIMLFNTDAVKHFFEVLRDKINTEKNIEK